MSLVVALWLGALAGPALAQPPNSPSDQSIQEIGRALQEAAGTADAKFVLFASFNDDFRMVTIRHVVDGSPRIRPLFLASGAIDLSRLHRELGSPDGFVELIYLLDHGRLNLSFRYPDQTSTHADSLERMEAAMREHFGPT